MIFTLSSFGYDFCNGILFTGGYSCGAITLPDQGSNNKKRTRTMVKTTECEPTHEFYVSIATSVDGVKRVLDAPAGKGMISKRMKKLGFAVTGADIEPEGFGNEDIPCVKVDLNGRLDLDDNSFDMVLCREGIEHVENQYHTIREFRRVLSSKGWLLISTPNNLNLRSRLSNLLVGGYKFNFRPPADEWPHIGSDHINHHNYYTLRAALRRSGYRFVQVKSFPMSLNAIALAFMVPFIALFTWLALRRETNPQQVQANKEIFKHLLSPALLFGKKLIILAQKEE